MLLKYIALGYYNGSESFTGRLFLNYGPLKIRMSNIVILKWRPFAYTLEFQMEGEGGINGEAGMFRRK